MDNFTKTETNIPIRRRTSVTGFVGFILAGSSTALMFILSVLSAIIEQASHGDVYKESATAAVILVFIISLMSVNLIAMILGIISMTKKDCKPTHGFWAVFISVAANLIGLALLLN